MEEIINNLKDLCDKMEDKDIPFYIYTPFFQKINVTINEKYLDANTMDYLIGVSRTMQDE